jgi:RNA polymerase sigma-70 factor (family 1)
MQIRQEDISLQQLQLFKEAFLKYYGLLCVYALKYVDDANSCKDIVQDCYSALWKKRGIIDSLDSLKSLLYKSVHDHAIDYLRQSSLKNENLDVVIAEHPLDIAWEKVVTECPDEELECNLLQEEIEECINHLSPQSAKIYKMSREQGLSNKEIAVQLHISVKTVEKHMTIALSSIRKHLMQSGYMSFIFYSIIFFSKEL